MFSAETQHGIEPFMAAIPVNVGQVLCEALAYRRNGYRASDAMRIALDRDEARRCRAATPAYLASLDPVEQRRRQIATRLAILRDKRLGASACSRIYIEREISALHAEINELAGQTCGRAA